MNPHGKGDKGMENLSQLSSQISEGCPIWH